MPEFSDNTISITPIPYGTQQPGYCVPYIDILAVESPTPLIKIIDQILDSFAPSPGIVDNTDTIVTMANKLVSASDTSYSTPATTATSITLTAFQRLCIVTATGQTIKLPPSNASGVIPATTYIIIFPANLTSAGTVGVTTGDSLNGTVNNTYAAPISLSVPRMVFATSTGSGWYAN